MTGLISSDVRSALLVGSDGIGTGVQHVIRDQHDRLIGIVCMDRYDQLVSAWEAAGGRTEDIYLIGLGDEVRSASTGPPQGPYPTPFVTGLQFDQLERLPKIVGGIPDRGPDERSVLYVSDIATLIERAGVGRTDAVVGQLFDELEHDDILIASLAAEAPAGVAAGLAPRFDRALEAVSFEDQTVLQPSGALESLSTAEIFDLLRPRRRRLLLRTLDAAGGELTLAELVERLHIHAIDEPIAENRDQIRLLLVQTDLRTLVDAGVITLGPGEETVVLEPRAIQLWPYLELADQIPGT